MVLKGESSQSISLNALNKILISPFQGAELLKQAWTSTYKSQVITKRRLKTSGMTRKIKWSQGDLNP